MSRRSAKRDAWLSVTPEPETELPAAVATLRASGPPSAQGVDQERERIERLVLHGTERRWLAYLSEVVGLIQRAPGAAAVEPAREAAVDVVLNHHQLLLGLPGDAAERTAPERELLAHEHTEPHTMNGRNPNR